MTFGIFQTAYSHEKLLHGAKSSTGVIGTTMNGVMYLSMPFLFTALDRGPWARWRRQVAFAGIALSSVAFVTSSFSTEIWHLVLTQGILAALGNAMLYSPTTLYLDERFNSGKATAYAATLASKNIVGTICPLIVSALLRRMGFRWTLRIWAGIVLVTGVAGLAIIPSVPSSARRSPSSTPWTFLKHRTFYIYSIANLVFSTGYGIPLTYLSSYASDVLGLSALSSALMITLFNAPGIISCLGFGLLSDRYGLSASSNTLISAAGSSVCAFLLWGTASNQFPGVLIAFSVCFGFFAGGYSSTWAGSIRQMEKEAADMNEAINTGMLYGLMNGARGIGYVASGLVGVELLNAGAVQQSDKWAFGTKYGGLILFTGVSCIVGGWSVVWRSCGGIKWRW